MRSFVRGAALVAVAAAALTAQTGTAVPGAEVYDNAIVALLGKWSVPGAALAVTQDGRLVYARGYGQADDEGHLVQPDSQFRICSLSKSVTAAGILKLYEEGKLDLDAKAFEILRELQPWGGVAVDPRVYRITVRQLLQHYGGWDDRAISESEYLQYPVRAAQAFGVTPPASAELLVRYVLGVRPLDHAPGTYWAYSNFGYAVLGRVIERVSGQSYEAYIRENVLKPMGITRMSIGGTLPAERSAAEVHYYDYPGAPLVTSVFADWPRQVPAPYGGEDQQMEDAFGGWISSPIDMVRFIASLEGRLGTALLKPETIRLMIGRPAVVPANATAWYGMGWFVYRMGDDAEWDHGGDHRGTNTYMLRRTNGRAIAVFFNSEPQRHDLFLQEVKTAIERADDQMGQWPAHDLFAQYPSPPAPSFALAGLVNAASYAGGGVAPGELVTLFGVDVGPASLLGLRLNGEGAVDTTLAGTRVFFDHTPAPLIYVSKNQSAVAVPYAVSGVSTTSVRVEYGGVRSVAVAVPVRASAPGIFTVDQSGIGQAAVLNQDTTTNSATNPAARGSVISIFATGEGQTDPAGADGVLAMSMLPKPLLPVSVMIGGRPAVVEYAGAAPGLVAGVMQVNARVPAEISPGSATLVLAVGEASSSMQVTVAVN